MSATTKARGRKGKKTRTTPSTESATMDQRSFEARRTTITQEEFIECQERRSTVLAVMRSNKEVIKNAVDVEFAAAKASRSREFRALQADHSIDFKRVEKALLKCMIENAQCCHDFMVRFRSGTTRGQDQGTAMTFDSLNDWAVEYHHRIKEDRGEHYSGHCLHEM